MPAIEPSGLTILSLTIDRDIRFAATGIFPVLAILAATMYILLKGVDAKWRGTEFGE